MKITNTESPAAQAAESVSAVGREQERIAFKDAHRHLELDEVPDAWGRPMFKHPHVEASWLGWIARASHGQAPAGATLPEGWAPLVIIHEGQYPEEIAYGPQRMMDRLDKWLRKYFDSVVAAPTTQPAPQQDVSAAGGDSFLLLPIRPTPDAPANTAGLSWDAYSGAQMLAYGRSCSDAALVVAEPQPSPVAQGDALDAALRRGNQS